MAGKRVIGEGSIYQRDSDGRLFGYIVVGDEPGEPKRNPVCAMTRESATKAQAPHGRAGAPIGRTPSSDRHYGHG
jgi:hypothetical protein